MKDEETDKGDSRLIPRAGGGAGNVANVKVSNANNQLPMKGN
jgi:hypothetical protein